MWHKYTVNKGLVQPHFMVTRLKLESLLQTCYGLVFVDMTIHEEVFLPPIISYPQELGTEGWEVKFYH